VKRHIQPLHADGPQLMDHRGREARARSAEAQILGPQLEEIVEKGRQVGSVKRISATDQEGAGPAGAGTCGTEDVARPELRAGRGRRLSPEQPGRTANQ
jgi:hypothetical protein